MRRAMVAIGLGLAGLTAMAADDYQSAFAVDKKTLGVKGSNPYFNLTPGYTLEYKNGKLADTISVLNETKRIDGVETRVVEHREMKAGRLIEVTRDYYAIDAVTNDVYYFGEEVDVIKKGKVVDHKGTWLAGEKGAKFGLMMPASPKAGQKYYQEQAPGAALDRVEVMSIDEKITTPAGTFTKCVRVLESSPLEKTLHDSKWYVAGVGQVKDGAMVLVRYGKK
ncbi:MAG: hypothetical protein NTV52_01440 [Acidobacteria bacterium]|nr:hypothetical protein [Acidobacteriota bacterium]